MKYRPDIEGLRAVAILLVVAAHAGIPGFEGGFIGVDVFFVISGYLITGLLIGEHARTGHIEIAAFYARRFRRLLPALLLMLLVTAIAVRLVLPSEERAYQAEAGAAASVWASNLYFAFARIDYFGAASESNAYLHSWSLGLEEQFYLVWPLLLLLLLPRRSERRARWLSWGFAIIVVVSLSTCLWMTGVSSRHAFYLMPFRAWQFAMGALAWLLTTRLSVLGLSHARLASALGVGSAALIVLSLILIDKEVVYPGAWAVLPSLGAAGLLLAATTGSSLVSRVLSVAPLQALGKVSYSWYLWHWPVLVIGAVLIPAPDLTRRLLLVAWALLFSVLSYRLVERPLRESDVLVKVPRYTILAAVLMMLSSVLLFARWSDSEKDAGSTPSGQSSSHSSSVPVIYAMGCDDWYHSDKLVPCVFGDEAAPRTAVVIGDSIGLQWFPAYAEVFSRPQWKLIVLTKSSCPMVNRPIFNHRIGREFKECASWREKALDHIALLRPDVVVMGTTHTADFDKDAWVDGTSEVLARMAPVAGKVFIMRSTPLLPFSGAQCVQRISPGAEIDWERAEHECSAPAFDPRNDEVDGWLRTAAHRWANTDVVDMNDAVCPEGICRAAQGHALVYRDNQHLDATFVSVLSGSLREKMGTAVSGWPELQAEDK
ncbi:acyltransferase family protein [Pseudoxanthomonas sp. LjRoot143]|uniref:acyltransferase family protein n=1 Tax=Pseudoxanthomonas sp. LjRoot143 TaxID=3342266 RepID=UPI003ECC2F6E